MNVQVQAKVVDAGHIVKVNSDGSLSVYNRYYENGKEKIARFPNEYMTAKHNYQLEKNSFRGFSNINAPVVSARTGAMSAGTVTATVTDHLGKRQVMGEVIEKARIGGRALGKGAATVGRVAASRTPYGIAFMLAVEALGGSKFFWSDEHGDFMRPDNNNTYIVLSTKHASSQFPDKLDEKSFYEFCANNYCQKVALVEGRSAAQKAAEEFCKARTYDGGTKNFNSIGWAGYCYDHKRDVIGDIGVEIVRWIDYVPMTLDEFIEESTPEAATKPDDWVKASEVKPTDTPKVEVPAGSVAQSDPYTDPKDRKVKQTRWDFDTGGRVREKEIERPDLTPDSPEAPELKPPVEEKPKDKDKDKESASEPKAASAPFDLCKEHPEILACQQMGEVKEEDGFFDDIEIPQVTDDTTWEEDRFLPSNGTCPAPKTFHVWGKPVQLSYEPLCRFMEMVRFIILVAFILMSAFLVFGSLRKE